MVTLALLFRPSMTPLETACGMEVVEDQLAMRADGAANFFMGSILGAHRLGTPLVENLPAQVGESYCRAAGTVP